MTDDPASSLLPAAGVGGLVVCCLTLELLGGAVLLGGLAATIGLTAGTTYLLVVALGGGVAAGLVLVAHRVGGHRHG